MGRNSRRENGSHHRKKWTKKNHVASPADEDRVVTADGKAKRVFGIPRRHEFRYLLRDGKNGSRLGLQEVFNKAHAEHEGCSYVDDEPLCQSDIYGINRDIRCHLYDIRKLRKGELTFMTLMKKHPVFLNELRSTIEKKWDLLQRCKAQWGVDWGIQRVLQRDRSYKKKKKSGYVWSRTANETAIAGSQSDGTSEFDADSTREKDDTAKEKGCQERDREDGRDVEDDEAGDVSDSSESISSEDEQKHVDGFSEERDEREIHKTVSAKSVEVPKKASKSKGNERSLASRRNGTGRHSAIQNTRDVMTVNSPKLNGNRKVRKLAGKKHSDPKLNDSSKPEKFQPPRSSRKRNRTCVVDQSENQSNLDAEQNVANARRTKRGRVENGKGMGSRSRKS